MDKNSIDFNQENITMPILAIRKKLFEEIVKINKQIERLLENNRIFGEKERKISNYIRINPRDFDGGYQGETNLSNPCGDFMCLVKLRKVLEMALIDGTVHPDELPKNSPGYLKCLVPGSKEWHLNFASGDERWKKDWWEED